MDTENITRKLHRLAEVSAELSDIFQQEVARLEKALPGAELTPSTAIVVKRGQDPNQANYCASIAGTSIVGFGDTEGEAIARALEVVRDLETFRGDILAVIGKQISNVIQSCGQ